MSRVNVSTILAVALLFAITFAGLRASEQHGGGATTVASRAMPLAFEELASLEHPWAVEVLPDGGFLITEKPGRLRIFRNGALSDPIAGVPPVVFKDQGGLLDVALDPEFARTGLIYLGFTEGAQAPGDGPERDTADQRLGVFQDLTDATIKGLAVARARLDGGRLRDVRVIWRTEKTVGRGHFGGRLAFQPDGALLITAGDRQRFEPAQDLNSDLGKIIRLRATDGAPMPDNPFATGPAAQRDIWSFGHRNPLGIAIRPGTDEVWVAEMGPQNGDEVNLILKGRNYGWPLLSAGDNYNATPLDRSSPRPGLEAARVSFPLAISPSSLTFYSGEMFAPWKGDLILATLNAPGLVRGVPAADGVHDLEYIQTGFRVRDVKQAPDGSILLLRDGAHGALVRVTPAKR